jgi:hypothetical protein
MEKQKLSQLYSYCTQEIQRLTTELYEQLHDNNGEPTTSWEQTLDNARKYKKLVILELEAMKSALKEYIEESDGKQLP